MDIDIKDSVEFVGFKCMLDCVYWYNRETDSSFDFDVAGGYANFTDEVIVDNLERLYGYVKRVPVTLMVCSNILSRVLNTSGYKLFNEHNRIYTIRDTGGHLYKYVSMPNNVAIGVVFAVISTEFYSNPGSIQFQGFRVDTHKKPFGFEVADRPEHVEYADFYKHYSKLYHCIEGADESMVESYLLKKVTLKTGLGFSAPDLVGNKSDKVKTGGSTRTEEIKKTSSDTVDASNEKTGKYDNVWELFKNKGKMQDRYNRLVSALDSIDTSLLSRLDKELEKLSDAADRTTGSDNKDNPVMSAAALMGGE